LADADSNVFALAETLIASGAAVAFLSTFSAIGKSRTRGSDRTVNLLKAKLWYDDNTNHK